MSKTEQKYTPYSISNRVLNKAAIDFSNSPSRTKSEFKDEVNINTIVKKAMRTGVLPTGDRQPLYADFTQLNSYETAQIAIAEAKSSFEQLPSDIRAKFDNNVTELLDFVDDEANKEEAIQLGLLPEEEAAPASEPIAPLSEPISESNNSIDSNKVDS
tara:strand:+ start:3388 stop:3861 length:474 start_codon:yes stop_codon:yes gene_type:complete